VTVGLTEALRAIEDVEGWLSPDQARALFEHAAGLRPPGEIVEIGSCQGRSTIVLGLGAGEGVRVIAIDPHAGNDRGPGQWETSRDQGQADLEAFQVNLARAGLTERVRHVRLRSRQAHREIAGPVALLYVDGSHRYADARADIADWGDRVRPGGWMLVHDAFSSVGVTLALLRELVPGRRFAYRGRVGSLALYERSAGPLAGRQRVSSAMRQLAQLPWFARNLLIKLALAAGLEPAARALGHRPGQGLPY
jgi:hypothetical protein